MEYMEAAVLRGGFPNGLPSTFSKHHARLCVFSFTYDRIRAYIYASGAAPLCSHGRTTHCGQNPVLPPDSLHPRAGRDRADPYYLPYSARATGVIDHRTS